MDSRNLGHSYIPWVTGIKSEKKTTWEAMLICKLTNDLFFKWILEFKSPVNENVRSLVQINPHSVT